MCDTSLPLSDRVFSVSSVKEIPKIISHIQKLESKTYNNFVVFHFQVIEQLVKTLLTKEPKSIERIKEQYADDANNSLIKKNIWAKYQNGKFTVKKTDNIKQEGTEGCILVSVDIDKKEMKEIYSTLEKQVIYASFLMKRYTYKEENGLEFYVDCVYYDDHPGCYALYGGIRVLVSPDAERLIKKFLVDFGNPAPVKSKIYHYISMFKDNENLPKDGIDAPLLLDCDPFYFGYN